MCDKYSVICDKPSTLRIATIHMASAPWVGRLLDGIRQYAEEKGDWQIFYIPPSVSAKISVPSISILKGWQGDGILFASNQLSELRFIKSLKIPAVNLVSGLEHSKGIPRVIIDNYQAGKMAAEHFLERNLIHLAFIGSAHLWYSRQRCAGLQDRAKEAGIECQTLLQQEHRAPLNWEQRIAVAADWLKSLPLPCGIFAVEDSTAQLLLDACKESGLRVPNDIAIIGMDNNETICEHSTPRLTSITRNAKRIGYEAAALLHQIIQGNASADQEAIVPPDGIILRESSDMLYCSDPMVQQAIEYMRQNIRSSYNIDAIASYLGLSKRTLERGFVRATNSPPYQYLTRLRIHHAQARMQQDPEKTCATVAAECGFGSISAFYNAFCKEIGIAPSTYRKSLQKKDQ